MDWNEFLSEAVAEKDADLVRQALAQGADPNECGSDWATPLFHAVSRGDIDIALALLKGGASVTSDRDEDTLTLHAAVEDANLPMVNLLLDYDGEAALNWFDAMERTPLIIAVQMENIKIAQRLLAAGADVNVCDEARAGNTALHKAVEVGSLKMVEMLLKSGADPLVKGSMGQTPLDKARDRKRGDGPRIYELLEQAAKRFQK